MIDRTSSRRYGADEALEVCGAPSAAGPLVDLVLCFRSQARRVLVIAPVAATAGEVADAAARAVLAPSMYRAHRWTLELGGRMLSSKESLRAAGLADGAEVYLRGVAGLKSQAGIGLEAPRQEAAPLEEQLRGASHPRAPSDPARADAVDCTVFAPPRTSPGETVLIQVFAHCPELAEQAEGLARDFDDQARRRGTTSLETEIARGSRIDFELRMRNAEVLDPVLHLVWRGRTQSVEFEVDIPENITRRRITGRVLVSQGSVPVGRVSFVVDLARQAPARAATPEPLGEARRYRTAFISYASKDRPEVLRRVQMLEPLQIEFFQDVLNLRAGERWQQSLYRHIDRADVFFLFWSIQGLPRPRARQRVRKRCPEHPPEVWTVGRPARHNR